MTTCRIVLRLARNPGAAHAEADDHRGYTLVAPLTPEGKLDAAAMKSAKATVRRFAPDADPVEGRIIRHGTAFAFDYGDAVGAEPGFKLGDHTFNLGDYVSVQDEDGSLLTYKVTEKTLL